MQRPQGEDSPPKKKQLRPDKPENVMKMRWKLLQRKSGAPEAPSWESPGSLAPGYPASAPYTFFLQAKTG